MLPPRIQIHVGVMISMGHMGLQMNQNATKIVEATIVRNVEAITGTLYKAQVSNVCLLIW